MKKKGASELWWLIGVAAVTLVVIILILFWFKGSGEGIFKSINNKIDQLKDSDNDGVADMFDKCSGTMPPISVDTSGCPKTNAPPE